MYLSSHKLILGVVAAAAVLLPAAAAADGVKWGGDKPRRFYVREVLGASPDTLETGTPPLGTGTIQLSDVQSQIVYWGSPYTVSSSDLNPTLQPMGATTLTPDGTAHTLTNANSFNTTIGEHFHYTFPVTYRGKQGVLSVKFERSGSSGASFYSRSYYNLIFNVFTAKIAADREASAAPDLSWKPEWGADEIPTFMSVDVAHFLKDVSADNNDATKGTHASAKRAADVFRGMFDIVCRDRDGDGTDEVYLFFERWLYVFNLAKQTVKRYNIDESGTHGTLQASVLPWNQAANNSAITVESAIAETLPPYVSRPGEYIYDNTESYIPSYIDSKKQALWTLEPFMWAATSLTLPGTTDPQERGILAMCHTPGDYLFGLWLPDSIPAEDGEFYFRYIGLGAHPGVQDNPVYTTIELQAHEVIPYERLYVATDGELYEDLNEDEHFDGAPVLLFAWNDYQKTGTSYTTVATVGNTSLLMLSVDDDDDNGDVQDFKDFFEGSSDNLWSNIFSKRGGSNIQAELTGAVSGLVTRPVVGAFRPWSKHPSSMIYFNGDFYCYVDQEKSGIELQGFYALQKVGTTLADGFNIESHKSYTDNSGERTTYLHADCKTVRPSGRPAITVSDAATGAETMDIFGWQEREVSYSTSPTGDKTLLNWFDYPFVGAVQGTLSSSSSGTREKDGKTYYEKMLTPVFVKSLVDDAFSKTPTYADEYAPSASEGGISPYPAPFITLVYDHSYVNASNPTMLWTASSPPVEADEGKANWYQDIATGNTTASTQLTSPIAWSAPSVFIEADDAGKAAFETYVAGRGDITIPEATTVTGSKDVLRSRGDAYTILGEPYYEDACITYAAMPLDSHVYTVMLSDSTVLGSFTVSQLREGGTFGVYQTSLSNYEYIAGQVPNMADVSGLYSNVDGDLSSYRTIASTEPATVAKYFTADAYEFAVGSEPETDTMWAEFNIAPETADTPHVLTNALHATTSANVWSGASPSSPAVATVTYDPAEWYSAHLKPADYNAHPNMRPVRFRVKRESGEWYATDWYLSGDDASDLRCLLTLADASTQALPDVPEEDRYVNIRYSNKLNTEMSYEPSWDILLQEAVLYYKFSGDEEWTYLTSLSSLLPQSGSYLAQMTEDYTHTFAMSIVERWAYFEKGLTSVYAYYKVEGTYKHWEYVGETTSTEGALLGRPIPSGDSSSDTEGYDYVPRPFTSNEVAVFLFSEATSGVEGIGAAPSRPEALYDVLGRRITGTPAPGVYITASGRKVFIR